MNCKEVFSAIDELNDKYIGVWEDVCNIESPTDCKEGVDNVSGYFIKIAEEHGWKAEVCKQEVSGNAVCITMNENSNEKPVSLSGHIDTVHPLGSFGSPAVHKDNEKIYGPGVDDCKGGVVAGFLAMEALEKCGYNKRPIKILLQTDEENNSVTSNKETINYICEKAKDSIAFLNLEGHTPGYACIERKGIITFTYIVSGVEAHASQCADLGANAILEAAHKIIELEKIKDADGLNCCCSVINGGTTHNTVPGKCVFKANVRFKTREQSEWIRKKAQEIADTVYVPGCSCELISPKGRYAMEYCERNAELLKTINKIFVKNGLNELEALSRKGGSDAADVSVYGIPCVDSIGVSGGKIHTTGEFANLASLAESAKRIAAVALDI